MSNLLSIPFKKTYELPVRERVRDYLLAHHPDTHPNAFKWDVDRWESLRKLGVGGVVHNDRVQSALRYVERTMVESMLNQHAATMPNWCLY